MGVCRAVFNAIFWPLVIYFALMGHVLYSIVLQEPEALKVQDFPQGAQKDAVINARKPIIKALKDAMAGTYKGDFAKDFGTEDIEIEDPLQRYSGAEAFSNLFLAGKE